MAINDAFMLPKQVRTMAQMADLLQAEQTELTQTQRTIAAMENQLIISTSTFLLHRHERLFELPVNTTESLEARRAKVLAKLNTRGTTTVEAIREMVSIVTGCDGAVVEHFSQYAFTVIVYMLFEGVFPDLSELIRQIDENQTGPPDIRHCGGVSAHRNREQSRGVSIPPEDTLPLC